MKRAVVVALAILGCGAPTSSGAPISAADFPTEAARADCRLLLACCTSTEISGIFAPGMTFASEADCRAYYEQSFRSYATAAQPHLDAGWTSWDASAAGECVAAIDAASCPDIAGGVLVFANGILPTSDPSCLHRYVGHQPVGATCGADLDCASGYCPDNGTMRVCAQLPGAGAACMDRCADGLACDVRAASPTCVALRPDGGACTPGFGDVCQSGNCRSDGTCGAGTPVMVCGGSL